MLGTGLKSHLIGEGYIQSHVTPEKDEAMSNGAYETSTQRNKFGRRNGLEEYKENLKRQEQYLKQQLQAQNRTDIVTQ